MRMQEPEPGRQSEQEWQTNQEYSGYHADNPGSYESGQQQKIYPTQERGFYGKVILIFSVVLSSIGFFLTVAGIVASAIVLKYANGQAPLVAGV